MRDIAIFGAGGFGREIACMINIINKTKPSWNLIGFYDDNPKLKGQMISHFGPCFGGVDALNDYEKELSPVIPIGSPSVVRKIVASINNPRIDYPNIIHPEFKIKDPLSFKIGKGNIIQDGCSVSCDVSIGDFNVMNGGVVFGHDVKVGNYNTFMPAVRISGEVTIGENNFLGVGSIVLQQIRIGDSVRIGAGSVLMTKPRNGNLYLGVPAKRTEL